MMTASASSADRTVLAVARVPRCVSRKTGTSAAPRRTSASAAPPAAGDLELADAVDVATQPCPDPDGAVDEVAFGPGRHHGKT